jgi:hypothetical protein
LGPRSSRMIWGRYKCTSVSACESIDHWNLHCSYLVSITLPSGNSQYRNSALTGTGKWDRLEVSSQTETQFTHISFESRSLPWRTASGVDLALPSPLQSPRSDYAATKIEPLIWQVMSSTRKQAHLAMEDTQQPSDDIPSDTRAQIVQQTTDPIREQARLATKDVQASSSDISSTTDAQLVQQTMDPTRKQAHLDMHDILPPSNDTMSTTNAQTQCILFRLPQELRDNIYERVFGSGVVEGYIQFRDSLGLAPQSALTLTCRQIHDEATPLHQAATTIYWAANVFRYTLSLDTNFPVLTTRRAGHMNRIILHNDFSCVHYDFDLRSAPCGYTLGLWHRPNASAGAPSDVMSYRLQGAHNSDGKWRISDAKSHKEDDCEGDDICNAEGTFYKHGSVGKGKFDALAKLW